MGREPLYEDAIREFGRALDRLAAGYEADPEKRQDLRQEIRMQLWRSLQHFDGLCSLSTWTFRVAHNTAVSYVDRERRRNAPLLSLEQVHESMPKLTDTPDLDLARARQQLANLVRQLKPLDRQIIICYLEGMNTAAIAEITGLSTTNIRMKIHRIKNLLASRFIKEKDHV